MTKNTHFVRRFIENATISDTLKLHILPIFSHKMKNVRHVSLHMNVFFLSIFQTWTFFWVLD